MKDRFGNLADDEAGYARGSILRSSFDEALKDKWAYEVIRRRVERHGPESVYDFTNVHEGFPLKPEDLNPSIMDRNLGALAPVEEELKKVGLAHMGGKAGDAVAMFNRVSAGIIVTILTLAKEGETVVSVTPISTSHPSIPTGARLARAKFVEVRSSGEFERILDQEERVSLVVVVGCTMEQDVFPLEELKKIVTKAKQRGILVFVDDASGARIRTIVLKQPKTLELGDIGITSMNKMGLQGPRVGLLAGREDLVSRIALRAFELGMDARIPLMISAVRTLQSFDPETLVEDDKAGEEVCRHAKELYGDRVKKFPLGMMISIDNVLEIALEKAKVKNTVIVPVEATMALGFLLFNRTGILATPIVTSPRGAKGFKMMIIARDLRRFGKAEAVVRELDKSFDELASIITNPDAVKQLILGQYGR